MFSNEDADSELKMIDFGLSKHFKYGEVLHEAVGTPYTVAPEVIRGTYDERCDVWAIGVITYLLLRLELIRSNIITIDIIFTNTYSSGGRRWHLRPSN